MSGFISEDAFRGFMLFRKFAVGPVTTFGMESFIHSSFPGDVPTWLVRMAEVPQLPLKDFFGLFAPTYVLGTTYTVSLAFFEGLVFPAIKRTNLQRCLILCDKIGFQRAAVESSALRSAGRDYMAVCAPARHSFHPKVWLMIGDGRAAVLVGSGNLTQSGFMDNGELFDVIEFAIGGPNRTAAEDVLGFLAGLRALWEGADCRRLLAVEAIEDMERELKALTAQMPEDEDRNFRFLNSFAAPLVEQFSDCFSGGTLQVAAPYFGGVTTGLQAMIDKLAPTETKVFPAVHGENELDVSLARATSAALAWPALA